MTYLKQSRLASGKTQAQIAKEAGISERNYQNYEHGRVEPGVRTAIRIADALGVEVKELFGASKSSG